MLDLIPGIAAETRPSWWSRHVYSGTHREPDRPDSPTVFLRTLVACVLLFLVLLLLAARFA